MKTQHVVGEVRKALTPDHIAEVLLAFRGQRNEIENQLIRGDRTIEQVQNFINHQPVIEDNIRPSKRKLFILHHAPIGACVLILAKDERDLLDKYDIIDDAAVSEALDGVHGEKGRERAHEELIDSVVTQKGVYYRCSEGGGLSAPQKYQGMVTWEGHDVSEEEVMVLKKLGLLKEQYE